MSVKVTDSPDLVRAKQFLDELKAAEFEFARTAPGPDGPLMDRRMTEGFIDVVYLAGFSRDCMAWRQRKSLLIVAGEGLVERRISGGAVVVLTEILSWGSEA